MVRVKEQGLCFLRIQVDLILESGLCEQEARMEEARVERILYSFHVYLSFENAVWESARQWWYEQETRMEGRGSNPPCMVFHVALFLEVRTPGVEGQAMRNHLDGIKSQTSDHLRMRRNSWLRKLRLRWFI